MSVMTIKGRLNFQTAFWESKSAGKHYLSLKF